MNAILMLRKEYIEMWRNYKWIWVTLVFVLLGLTQPIMTHFLPDIMESQLPEGAVFEFPIPGPGQVMAESLEQFGLLGVLVLVLSGMGTVASERQSGVAGLILVRPVAWSTYVATKWVAIASLSLAAFGLGYGAAWYYTVQLIGTVDAASAFAAFGLYVLWLLFIGSLTVAFSTLLKTPGAAAAATLLTVIALTVVSGLFDRWLAWSPARLSSLASAVLSGENAGLAEAGPVLVASASIVLLLAAATFGLKRKELIA